LLRITIKNKSYFKSRVRAALDDYLPEHLTVQTEHSDVITERLRSNIPPVQSIAIVYSSYINIFSIIIIILLVDYIISRLYYILLLYY